MKYKVGDKVWLIKEKKYGIISKHNIGYANATKTDKVDFDYSMKGYDNIWAFAPIIDFVETFDTMITRLGFEKQVNNVYDYACAKEKYNGYRIIVQYNSYGVTLKYTNVDLIATIDQPLHEALTQLMAELEAQE